MDSKIERQQQGLYPNEVVEGDEENRQGKTSMLKKVKAKARKIKDTIKMKTGHDNQDPDNNQNDQDHEEEEVGDEDEEMVEDSEAHDAVPMYESPAVMSTTAGQKPEDKLGKPVTAADRDGSLSSSGNFGTPGSESAGNFVHGEGGNMGHPKISTETPTSMEEDPHAAKDQPEVPNYQSKVADPTGAGGEEAGVTQILHSFNKMNVHGEPESKSEGAPELYPGSHDQSSPEPIPPTSTTPGDTPLDNVTKVTVPSNQSSYTGKISYATSAIAGKAIAAKDAVVSKLGYGGNEDPNAGSKAVQGGEEIGSHNQFSSEPIQLASSNPGDTPLGNVTKVPSNQSSYTEKISYATSAIAGKAVAAKDTVVSKLGYGGNEDHNAGSKAIQGGEEIGSHNQFSSEPIQLASSNPRDAPLDNVTKVPSNQSSYTEKISYATSAIAGKAVAAKDAVVSKLGYGGNVDPNAGSKDIQEGEGIGKTGTTDYGQNIGDESKTTQGGEEIGKTGTTAGYGQKVVAPVTEKLAPVYEKVSSLGSSVVSKVRGTATKQDEGVEGQDQVVSVKEYLAEKLRPSDEDKALSDVISDSLRSRKQGVDGEEEVGNQKPAVGIVTESEEVRERLGTDEVNREMTGTESKVADNVSATGKGMVESVKGTVTGWFSRGGDQKQDSEASPGTIPEEDRFSSSTGEEAVGHGQNGVGERRVQESG